MLLIIFLPIDQNISINQNIIEQKELPCFQFLPARLHQNSFANQNTSLQRQWLPSAAERRFDGVDATQVDFDVDRQRMTQEFVGARLAWLTHGIGLKVNECSSSQAVNGQTIENLKALYNHANIKIGQFCYILFKILKLRNI